MGINKGLWVLEKPKGRETKWSPIGEAQQS